MKTCAICGGRIMQSRLARRDSNDLAWVHINPEDWHGNVHQAVPA
jgi:hypothetical protein